MAGIIAWIHKSLSLNGRSTINNKTMFCCASRMEKRELIRATIGLVFIIIGLILG
jgi:hypothetical protein